MRQNRTIILVICLAIMLSPPTTLSLSWTTPVQLTNNTGIADANPVTSRDGTRIAYQAVGSALPGSEIFALNPDGSGNTRLTSNTASDFFPSITADGSTVVFFSNADGDFEVFKVRSDGTGLTQLTSNSRHVDSFPTVSSDGSTIAFQSNRTGNLEIFVMKSDGSNVRQLTFSSVRDQDASISANGSLVAYVSYVASGGEVFVARTDGSSPPFRLTNNSCRDEAPMISGDGQYVVFQSDCDGDFEIMIIRTDGTGLWKLTQNTRSADQSAVVNFDASVIVYMSNSSLPGSNSNPEGDFEIFAVDNSGTHFDQLTNNSVHDGSPSVEGAGGRVVYQSDADGLDTELFLVITGPARDVAVGSLVAQLQVGDTHAYIGTSIPVLVTILNKGDLSETVTVSLYYNSTLIESKPGIVLSPGTSSNLQFVWSTSGLSCANYLLRAEVSPVPGESHIADNGLAGPVVVLRIAGDVDADRDVDIIDAATLAFAYDRLPGQQGWNPNADLDNDNDIDIIDAANMAINYDHRC